MCEQQKLQFKLQVGEFRVTHFFPPCLAPRTASFMKLHCCSAGAGTEQLRQNTCISGQRDQELGPFCPECGKGPLIFFPLLSLAALLRVAHFFVEMCSTVGDNTQRNLCGQRNQKKWFLGSRESEGDPGEK